MSPTLLGNLAQFGSFSMQSEVLCTQGLAYLLHTQGGPLSVGGHGDIVHRRRSDLLGGVSDARGTCADVQYRFELEQAKTMYRVLSGAHVAPLASVEELEHWRERVTDLRTLVDEVTRRLTTGGRLLPLREEPLQEAQPDGASRGYVQRYVCRIVDGETSYFSVGVRDSFVDFVTTVWMRFHKNTGSFPRIRQRIRASSVPSLESDGDLWIPLEVPLEAPAEQMVQALLDQAGKAARTAYLAD